MVRANKKTGITKQAWLGLGLAGTMLLTACSNGGGNTATSGNTGNAKSNAGSQERVTLKVEVWDRGNAPDGLTITDNHLSRYVQENFGDPNNIDVKYVPVPRSEEVQKLNILMASGNDVPDIVFTYDSNTFNRYAQQGGLTDVGPLIDEYGPELKTFLGDVLTYGQFEGKQLSIPAKRNFVGKYTSFIRQDWLDKLGLQAPKNADELYTVLKAFKEQDPGNTEGQVIPFGMTVASAQYEPLLWSFIQPLTEEERFTLTQQLGSNDYPTLLPGFKDGLQYLNKLYNEGLISTDFVLDKDKKKLSEDVSTGRVGFFTEDDMVPLGHNMYLDTLQKNIPGATLTPFDAFANAEGKYAKPMYAPNGMYIMIPKSSKRAVEAVKYLNWMADQDTLFFMQNGVEGENYTLVDGIPVVAENVTEEAESRLFPYGDLTIISNGKQLGDDERNMKARALAVPAEFYDKAMEAQRISTTDLIPIAQLSKPVEAQTKYGTMLLDKFNEIIVKTTMAKPEQFDSVYETMIKDYLASGGQAILDERKAVYQEMQTTK